MDMARQSTSAPLPVLLTRPEAEARGFARLLVSRFGEMVRPVVAPLMVPRLLNPRLPAGPFEAVIFTSAQAVAGASRLSGLPGRAYCVGRKTAEAARLAGFDARSADGDAGALVAAILADPPKGALLYLRAADTRGEVAERLTQAGVTTVSAVIYRQDPCPLSAEAVALLQGAGRVLVPLFSPRSARIFAEALPADAQAALGVAALSPAVAEVAAELNPARLVVAGHPDAQGMLDAVATLLAEDSPP